MNRIVALTVIKLAPFSGHRLRSSSHGLLWGGVDY